MTKERYSILIIQIHGVPYHITRFIKNLKKTNPLTEISLISNREKSDYSIELLKCLEEYIQYKKNTHKILGISKLNSLLDIFVLQKQFRKLSKKKHYDIVNLHFPQPGMCFVMKYLKKMSSCVVISPWGSDVLRVSSKKGNKRLAYVFREADYNTAGKKGDLGKKIMEELKIDEGKFHPLSWGSNTIDYINTHLTDISREEAKERLNLGNRFIITCGYNAFEEQRHENMIQAVQKIRNQLPDNFILLFPVTYGVVNITKKKDYIHKLKKICEDLEMPAVFFEDYLKEFDVFLLRRATDMFLHIQTTDAGSSSVQEYVLCGAKVVHGSWVHYNYLEQFKPLFYYPVKQLEELDEVILNAYHSEPIEVPNEVIEYIQSRSWREKMILWNKFFVSCLNKFH